MIPSVSFQLSSEILTNVQCSGLRCHPDLWIFFSFPYRFLSVARLHLLLFLLLLIFDDLKLFDESRVIIVKYLMPFNICLKLKEREDELFQSAGEFLLILY